MVDFGRSAAIADPFVLFAIAVSVLGLIVFSRFEEPPQQHGTILLFGGLTLGFATLYATDTLAVISTTTGLVLGSLTFVLVNVGGYITYRETTA